MSFFVRIIIKKRTSPRMSSKIWISFIFWFRKKKVMRILIKFYFKQRYFLKINWGLKICIFIKIYKKNTKKNIIQINIDSYGLIHQIFIMKEDHAHLNVSPWNGVIEYILLTVYENLNFHSGFCITQIQNWPYGDIKFAFDRPIMKKFSIFQSKRIIFKISKTKRALWWYHFFFLFFCRENAARRLRLRAAFSK